MYFFMPFRRLVLIRNRGDRFSGLCEKLRPHCPKQCRNPLLNRSYFRTPQNPWRPVRFGPHAEWIPAPSRLGAGKRRETISSTVSYCGRQFGPMRLRSGENPFRQTLVPPIHLLPESPTEGLLCLFPPSLRENKTEHRETPLRRSTFEHSRIKHTKPPQKSRPQN